ncbi:MAG: ribosome biogenesis GTPase Der [Desulfovibrio sp.]|nr:ribosome biogenesis GTPase Der [Desulfovibrio sp.]
MLNRDLPKIVLLGRPNVGKSTLFNRLIRQNRAITHNRPGVTRDRLEGLVRQGQNEVCLLVDTGGLTEQVDSKAHEGPDLAPAIWQQVQKALESAKAILLVVDAREGLLPMDSYLADLARRTNLPVLVVVNKVDGLELAPGLLADFHSLGLPLLAVSAAHGLHLPELLTHLVKFSQEAKQTKDQESLASFATSQKPQALRLALLGRPNAGKSSLVNAFCGEERMIISEQAGTTRDSVDVAVRIKNEDYVFVDTAGVRKKAKIDDELERFSVNAALTTSARADVTLLVLDASKGLHAQDKRLISLLEQRKTPFLILINKSDLLSPRELDSLRKDLSKDLSFCAHVPVLAVSAKTHAALSKVLPLVRRLYAELEQRIPTAKLNRAMAEVLARHQPPMVRQARPKFFYLTQAESKPPTFVFFVSDATRVPESYLRYLERGLRKLFEIHYAPIRMHLRSSHK